MIRMTVALTRLPHLSREAFQAYWFGQHGPLVRSLAEVLGIVEYTQLHMLDEPPADVASAPARWKAPYDGLAEIWYAGRAGGGLAVARRRIALHRPQEFAALVGVQRRIL